MTIPNLECSIDVYCPILPSENPQKIEHAVSNILSQIDIKINNNSLTATSTNLESLGKIHEIIHRRRIQNNYSRQLNHNLIDNTTWFYLNKQAAFANVVSLCSEADESPLGPIKIILKSKKIERVIDWLVSA
jgi:hypothetical protein